jgi:hypothetical protein
VPVCGVEADFDRGERGQPCEVRDARMAAAPSIEGPTPYKVSGTVAFGVYSGQELTGQKGCRQATPGRETVVAGHFRDTGE